VADAAVIGVPDDKWGEAVKAIVVLRPGWTPIPPRSSPTGRTLIAGYKAPKSVDFVDALPRNPSGKVLRRELRAPYWEGRGPAGRLSFNPFCRWMWTMDPHLKAMLDQLAAQAAGQEVRR